MEGRHQNAVFRFHVFPASRFLLVSISPMVKPVSFPAHFAFRFLFVSGFPAYTGRRGNEIHASL
jgi:hypothetical protein